NYLEELFQTHGYKATQYPTVPDGSPVVYAERNVGAPKTLLFYHHYDVQPEDPLDAWDSSPWELTERDGRLFGRGTVDNKGEIIISLYAMQLLEEKLSKLPVNVKFIIEGEEEAGSDNLPHFTKSNPALLRADGCIWEGATLFPTEDHVSIGDTLALPSPAVIVCGLKGITYFEIKAGGVPKFPNRDVHSGMAAAVPNAAWRIVWALNTLKDEKENILIEGFNELVSPPEREDIKALKEALKAYGGEFEEFILRNYELDKLLLDRKGLDFRIELHLKPSLSICGLNSGFQEPGGKTIVPAEASAKVDIRLVPKLTTNKVTELLRAHLIKKGFEDLEVELITGYDPAKTSVTHPFIQMLQNVTQELVTPKPVNIIPVSYGSGPAYLFTPFTPLAMVGNSIEGTNGHAPNENIPINAIKPSLAYNAFLVQQLALKE
ncbi:MAG: M20/M25/M40 family metallo-hydrolase, partial [Promethearchaeota archaeon]